MRLFRRFLPSFLPSLPTNKHTNKRHTHRGSNEIVWRRIVLWLPLMFRDHGDPSGVRSKSSSLVLLMMVAAVVRMNRIESTVHTNNITGAKNGASIQIEMFCSVRFRRIRIERTVYFYILEQTTHKYHSVLFSRRIALTLMWTDNIDSLSLSWVFFVWCACAGGRW